jgi:ABC-2 type transport system permease protein
MRRAYVMHAKLALQEMLAYRAAFFMGLVGNLFFVLSMFYLWHVLLRNERFAAALGWSWSQMKAYLLIGFVTGTLVSTFSDWTMANRIRSGDVALDLARPIDYQKARFEGTWNLSWFVNRGELDFMLLRPVSPVAQVMSSAIGMNGLGNLLLGGTLIGLSLMHVHVHWTAARIVMAVVLLLSAIAIKIGLNLATNASAFWLQNPFSAFAFSMHQLGDLARYPITIYALAAQALITAAIPFAFISFFPAGAVFSKGDWQVGGVDLPLRWLGLATPLVAAYCLGLGVLVFRRGLRRYESAGN